MNEVYRKFGEASELAQLLEHELGTLLIRILDITPKLVTSLARDGLDAFG